MAIDGKFLGKARAKLAIIKGKNDDETLRRKAEIHSRQGEVYMIDKRLRAIMLELFSSAISGSADVSKLEKESLELQARRVDILVKLGYPSDYLEAVKTCKICSDTGYVMGKMCSCLRRIYEDEISASLSSLIKKDDESFENFDLTLYEGGAATYMQEVFSTCRTYAEYFSRGSMNLLFRGGTGLGKTYLSACIARVVSERNFSVVYESAGAAFEAFEEKKFSNNPESTAPLRVSRMMDCDLMILDDLGTEMPSAVATGALYTLINSRIIEGKSTIISTNLSKKEIERKYSAQIASRIDGEFEEMLFYGRDIRAVKKERG